jgi:hypothetical protein
MPTGGGRATAQQLVAACQGLLGRLQAAGYICAYQLTWGGLPGGWAADWASEPGVQGDPVEPEALPAAFPFQVRGLCVVLKDGCEGLATTASKQQASSMNSRSAGAS